MEINIITKRVIELLRENVDLCREIHLDDSTALITSNLLDSFSLVSLLSVFETEFSIQFDIDELEIDHFETPLKIAEMIKPLMN